MHMIQREKYALSQIVSVLSSQDGIEKPWKRKRGGRNSLQKDAMTGTTIELGDSMLSISHLTYRRNIFHRFPNDKESIAMRSPTPKEGRASPPRCHGLTGHGRMNPEAVRKS